jgi:hypothetical protein
MAVDFDEAKVNRNEFGMWLGWTLATVVGLLVGYLPLALLVNQIELGIARIIVPLFAGLLIGLAQWVVLRQFLTDCRDWMLNLTASWVAGYSIGLLVVDLFSNSFIGLLVSYILFGLIVALFQWPILRREVPHIFPWILANVLGWTLGALVSQLVVILLFGVNPGGQLLIIVINSAVIGLIAGGITGLALVLIVRQPERGVLPTRS